MNRPMTSETERRLLELIADAVGFEYLTYVPALFPHRSGLLYNRVHAHMPVWNPLVDDEDLFRLVVAAPAVNLQEITNSLSQTCQHKFEIRCAFVREAFVRTVATIVAGSCPNIGPGSVNAVSLLG